MKTTVMVGEKPKVASRIAQALGDYSIKENRGVKNYVIDKGDEKVVIAPAVGHIFNLEQVQDEWTYPVFELEWKPIFETEDDAGYVKKYFNNLQDQLEEADEYINACDYDLEGAVIGYNVLDKIAGAEDDRIKRMKFSTLTTSDLREAYDDLESLDRGMTDAGLTRHVLDFYYGINVSRALMQAVRENDRYKTLSTGRVQGPTLKLLADREREIQEFDPEPYWELYLLHEEFEAQWEGEEDRMWDEEFAEQTLTKVEDQRTAEVTEIDRNDYKHGAPIPFNLTGLQSEASSQFNISPKRTQSIAQDLYEQGLISYPRTESQKLPAKLGYETLLGKLKKHDDYEDLAEKVLDKDEIYPRQGSKEDDAHPAIYPTGEHPSGLSKQERQIFDLVVKRFLAVFGDSARRRTLTFTLTVNEEEFSAQSKKTLERNWFDLYEPYVNVDEVDLPEMDEGEVLEVEGFDLREKETQPPRRYSQSSVVNELEKRNLGTKCLTADQEVIIRDEEGSITSEPVSSLFGASFTNEGNVQITEGMSNLEVIGYNQNFSLSSFAGISRRELEEDEEVVEIQLSDGSRMRLTSNHPVKTGEKESRYKEAGELESGDKILRAHPSDIESGNTVTFSEFLTKVDEISSLYGDCNLRRYREKRAISQRELAEELGTPRSTLSKVERRKRGLLRYWKRANIDDPKYLSSENFELKIHNPFPLEISPAFMRVVGMLQGDGSLDSSGKSSENKLDFRYHNTDKELIEQFCRDIETLFGYKPDINSQAPSTGSKKPYHVHLPAVIGRIIYLITDGLSSEWMEKQSNKEHYVGALLCDEGHVSPSEPKIFISNKDSTILENCANILNERNIDTKENRNQQKLYIRGRRNLERFLEEIPVFSTKKHQALIDLLGRHYKYGTGKGSLKKQRDVLNALQQEPLTFDQIKEKLGVGSSVVKHHLNLLRKKEYVEKTVKGKSELPRKEVLYQAKENLADTFYSELDREARGEAHTALVESIEEIDYNGYVYDILDTENGNFLLKNRVLVHNSTRAQTVDRLYDRNFIDNNPIEVTELGLTITETLEEHVPDLLSEELTRRFEEKMDAIRDGDETPDEVLDEAREELEELLTRFKQEEKEIGKELVETIDAERKRRRQLGPCDQCDDGTLRIVKANGNRFVGCSNYPDCENTYPLPGDGKIESMDETCEECHTPKIQVFRGGGNNYSMCIDPDCPTKDDW